MKKLIFLILAVFFGISSFALPPVTFEQLFNELKMEINKVSDEYNSTTYIYFKRLEEINKEIKNPELNSEKVLRLLLEKDDIKEKIHNSGISYNFKLVKLRYKKGIDLIKLLYEKILDLDHHFTALNTYQNIANISNPNSYPEFIKSKDALTENIKNKSSIELPDILKSNIYVSLATTVVSSFLGSGKKKLRKEEMDNISCILDFTALMHSDLNIIYYETEFLKDNNISLNNEINKLFFDYTKVIKYKTNLKECRNNDDWDNIDEHLDLFLKELEKMIKKPSGSPENRKALKYISNLEFSLDKVLNFLNKYSSFVDQGSKYYNKFYKIINNYKNVNKCSSKLPNQYERLKSDIKLSIEKFKTAYDIGELKGTGLRDLIYGVPDAYN